MREILLDVEKPKRPASPKLRKLRDGNQAAVDRLKIAIGKHVLALRGGASQDAIEETSGVDRGIISDIENGSSDYRIDTLLRVLLAIGADESVIFGAQSSEGSLHNDLNVVLRSGVKSEIRWVMEILERSVAAVSQATARSGPKTTASKPPRPA